MSTGSLVGRLWKYVCVGWLRWGEVDVVDLAWEEQAVENCVGGLGIPFPWWVWSPRKYDSRWPNVRKEFRTRQDKTKWLINQLYTSSRTCFIIPHGTSILRDTAGFCRAQIVSPFDFFPCSFHSRSTGRKTLLSLCFVNARWDIINHQDRLLLVLYLLSFWGRWNVKVSKGPERRTERRNFYWCQGFLLFGGAVRNPFPMSWANLIGCFLVEECPNRRIWLAAFCLENAFSRSHSM